MARLFTGREVIDDWSPLDGVPAPEFIPPQWTGPHVQVRLADAWRILSKMPWRSPYPRTFGRWWPSYRVEWHDLLAMLGAGELEAMQREANRTRILPSAKEISQMEQAIGWPMEYLREDRHVLIVNVCARVTSFDGDLEREIRRRNYGGDVDQWRQLNWKFCDNIADQLIVDRVTVF
ncbi:MAG TPA: hypothetical protein VGQ63_13845 [Pseudolabrys sp.]|jgi:hypothetical protein|nr:hypothetical protein [Pseudolabrys sp.]